MISWIFAVKRLLRQVELHLSDLFLQVLLGAEYRAAFLYQLGPLGSLPLALLGHVMERRRGGWPDSSAREVASWQLVAGLHRARLL